MRNLTSVYLRLIRHSSSQHSRGRKPNGHFEAGDSYDQPDLDVFFTNFAPNIPNGTQPILRGIDGGTAPTSGYGRGESGLDFDIACPLLYPQGLKVYQTLTEAVAGGRDPKDPFDPDIFANGYNIVSLLVLRCASDDLSVST
jgi:hypothetical protein